MKRYTQAEFDALPRDEYGVKHCPSGDYSQVNNFDECCRFNEGCSFGEHCSFGGGCSFGKWCGFGEGCSFGEDCSFDKWCSFEGGQVTGNVSMIQISRIGSRQRCTYFWRHDKGVYVRCGCFTGTLYEFAAQVEETHQDNPQYLREYRGAITYIESLWLG